LKNNQRKKLQILMTIVFLVSTAMMIYNLKDRQAASDSYRKAQDLLSQSSEQPSSASASPNPSSDTSGEEMIPAVIPPKDDMPQVWVPAEVQDDAVLQELKKTDISALKSVNEDVVGWILIPDSPVNYPLLQGDDNHYYLKYTWDNKRSDVGAIYLDSTVDPALNDFHTIVYGHNLVNGTMFSTVLNYADQEYYNSHPYIYLSSDGNVYRYEIYSAYEADIVSNTYRLGFKNTQDKTDFIDMGLELSVIETGVVPKPTDRVITISTCMNFGYDTRWVVHARLETVPLQN